MTQIQLTTREAVENAIYAMAEVHGNLQGQPETREELMASCKLLCELYGFKTDQFFGASAYKRMKN